MRSAKALLEAEAKFQDSKVAVERILLSRRHNLSREEYRAWRGVTRQDKYPIARLPDRCSGPFEIFWDDVNRYDIAASDLNQMILRETEAARVTLLDNANRCLPNYLVFSTEQARLLLRWKSHYASRNKITRARERRLLLYLQRVCSKNDTLSEFGPASWGRVDSKTQSLLLDPVPGVMQREVFLERW